MFMLQMSVINVTEAARHQHKHKHKCEHEFKRKYICSVTVKHFCMLVVQVGILGLPVSAV
jgi:hypothetical protein